MKFYSFILVLFFIVPLKAQEDIKSEIDFYGDAMVYTYDSLHRVYAGNKFYDLFTNYLKETSFESDDLAWNKWASVLTPENQNFRIITWELKSGEEAYEYFGFVQYDDNRLIELSGSEEYWSKLSYDERPLDDWPQMLYYKMQTLNENTILLFGINRSLEFENVQVVEVLKIDGDELSFGAPVFTHESGDKKYRLVFKYANDARLTLNYNEDLNLLIFDHLIERIGRIPGQGATLLPDGSYEAYKIEKDKLVYVEKVFDHIYDEAPRPMPKSDKESKNIFGKNKKG